MENETNFNSTQNCVQNNNSFNEYTRKKKKKKKWIIIAVIILAIIIIGSAFGSSDDSQTQSQTNNNSSIQKIETTSTTEAPKEKEITAGNEVTTDGLKIKYLSCDPNYKKYNSYLAPKSGNKVVRTEFEFENVSKVDQYISGTDCYADDAKCELYFGSEDSTLAAINSISPGRKVKAAVYYEVPKDSKKIELEIDGNFWKNEKIIFIIK